jgi:hypothetical protein
MSEATSRRIARSRYLVFAGRLDCPRGGWRDFVSAFEDMDSATECARNCAKDAGAWAHVADIGAFGEAAILTEFKGV